MSRDYGFERRDITGDNVEKRTGISVDGEKCGFRSQDTSLSSSRNCGESVDGDCICRYRSHTIHSSSCNPGGRGILLRLSVASCCVHEIIYKKEKGDISGDNLIHGFRYQETIHSSFHSRG